MAVTTTVWLLDTVLAEPVKLAVPEPLETVTEPGTVNAAALLESVTDAPPVPAVFNNVTTQVDVPPELRLVGAHANELKAGAMDTSARVCVWELPFSEAVMTAVWSAEIAPAVAVKLADIAPDATFTEAGTVRAAALLDRVTVIPLEPAACDSVTVQADVPPKLKLVGLHDTRLTVVFGTTSEIDAVLELPLYEAVTTADWLAVIVPAVAVKLADIAPDATFTEEGTVSAATLLDRVTVIPLEPAACDSVTMQADAPPELKPVGLHDTRLTVVFGATSEMDAVLELPLYEAVTTADWLAVIVPAVAVKLAEAAPDATFTDAGTENSLAPLERSTVAPPAGAGWLSEAAQVDEAPLVSDVGLHESPVNAGNETGGDERVTVPPVPVIESWPPAELVASGSVSPTGVVTAEVVIVTVITATTPFCIGVPLNPDSRHVLEPALEKQLIVFPAAVTLAPETAVMEETLPAE